MTVRFLRITSGLNMDTTTLTVNQLRARLVSKASELGVDCIGFVTVEDPADDRERLFSWLARGYHASMNWMTRDPERRADVTKVLPGARTVISMAINYNTGAAHCDDCGALKVSRYAWGEDYHKVFTEKLEALRDFLHELLPDQQSVGYVDTGPILEKAWAQRAGLGWIGKNANLVTRQFGSWVFLGEIITTAELPPDDPHTDFCGSCSRCIDACPTDAFPEPYVLDSNKCIAYWTIEHRGEFPDGISSSFDGWVFGCDICQDVCPWNKFGRVTDEKAFAARPDVICPPEDRWMNLTEVAFQQEFANSPIRRARREGLTRNIQSQCNDPLESVLRVLEWKPIEDFEDITLDEIGR